MHQRVNSSVSSTNSGATVSASSTPQNKMAPPTPTTSTRTGAVYGRPAASGKVNLNHRPREGHFGQKENNNNCSSSNNKRESKQSASRRVVASHCRLKTTTTATINASSSTSPDKQRCNGSYYLESALNTTPPAATAGAATLTEADGGENDQVEQNSTNNYLLSVALSERDLHDKKQNGNNKQSNRHLSGHTNLPTTKQTTTGQQLTNGNNNNNSNNCYNHHDDVAKSTLTKSAAFAFSKRGPHSCSHAINDRMCPKPMGQQVLSLMMLDVGLMPANNYNQQNHAPPKRSHVRLQSPTKLDQAVASGGGANSHLPDDGKTFIIHERDPANRLNACDDANEQSRDCEQEAGCNNYHSLQSAHDMPRLQVRMNPEMADSRSISLPTSPRIGIRACTRNSAKAKRGSQALFSRLNSLCKVENLLVHDQENKVDRSRYVSSALSCDQSYLTDRLISVCDNQDAHSLTSSSCSSLNQCPPLLALSNQLNVLKFEELVRANVDSFEKHKQNVWLDETGTESTQTASTIAQQRPLDQVAQVAKQHEILTSDSSAESEKHHSGKINHVRKGTHQFVDSLAPDNSSSREQTSEISLCSGPSQVNQLTAETILHLDQNSAHLQLRLVFAVETDRLCLQPPLNLHTVPNNRFGLRSSSNSIWMTHRMIRVIAWRVFLLT